MKTDCAIVLTCLLVPARVSSLIQPKHAFAVSRSQTLWSLSSSREDEIAGLEAKLRQLKQEVNDEEGGELMEPVQTTSRVYTPNRFDNPMSEMLPAMLSESWKESDTEPQGGEGIGSILPVMVGALLTVAFFVFFSQIPIGQENYSKYSAVKTSSQIDLGDLNGARKAVEGL